MSIFSKLRLFKKDNVVHANSTIDPIVAGVAHHAAEIDLQSRFKEGIALHQSGQLAQAQAIYESILQSEPGHADALHYLGVIALQSGDSHRAAALIGQAIAVNPSNYGYYMNHGSAFKQVGELEAALSSFDKAIALRPEIADAHVMRGNTLQDLQQFDAALASFDTALSIAPNDSMVCYNRGNALMQLGRHDSAIASFDQAIAIEPQFAEAWINRGLALQTLVQLDAALASFDKAIAIKPQIAEVHFNRAGVLRTLGQLDAAVASLDSAIAIRTDFAAAYFQRGVALQELHQLDAAITSYDAAITYHPDYAEAYANRGVAQHAAHAWDAALASYGNALRLNPKHAPTHLNRGLALHALKQWGEALDNFNTAIALQPDFEDAHCSRGRTLIELGQLEEALTSFETSIKLAPALADAHYNRGVVLQKLRRLAASEDSYREALRHNPQLSDAHHNLATQLQSRGDISGAQACYRSAFAHDPSRADSHAALLYCLSSDVHVDAITLFKEQLNFGEHFEGPLRKNWQAHTNSPVPGRALKVGIVSADLYNHAIATFLEPLLQPLSAYPHYSFHAYYNNTVQDAVNARLKTYFSCWSDVATMSDDALAQKIRDDGIDILIDLSGHTGMHRLLTFARKPAPIQITWMGFPGTTGLQSMDYYLTDRHFFPPGTFDHLFTEKLVYLPGSAPFLPSPEAPAVNALPALRNGYLTFGSFNKLKKFSPEVVALWAQVLRSQPDARMLIGGMESQENPTITAWFAKEGIDNERLQFFPVSDLGTYLKLHHLVDICLDTFPYSGGTTTMHALWMGVPTLTLSGSTPVSRTTSSAMGHLGLQSFCADTSQEFVDIGLNSANRLEELASIRANMREKFAATALGQPATIASGVDRALRTMWNRWCNQLPPVSFGEM
jgi:protein O-GlcNAc transferase